MMDRKAITQNVMMWLDTAEGSAFARGLTRFDPNLSKPLVGDVADDTIRAASYELILDFLARHGRLPARDEILDQLGAWVAPGA